MDPLQEERSPLLPQNMEPELQATQSTNDLNALERERRQATASLQFQQILHTIGMMFRGLIKIIEEITSLITRR